MVSVWFLILWLFITKTLLNSALCVSNNRVGDVALLISIAWIVNYAT